MFKKYYIILFTALISINSLAQNSGKPPVATGAVWVNGKNSANFDAKRWTIGVQTGILGFHGDLTKHKNNRYGGHFSDSKYKFNGGLVVKYSLSHVLSLRLSGYAGTFDLTNNNEMYGGYYFKLQNHMKALEMQLYVNLGNVSFLRQTRSINLYMFTGVGAIFNKFSGTLTGISPTYADINFANDPYWSKHKKSHYATVPVGLGLMYKLNDKFDLGLETGLRYTRTDSLDFASYPIHTNRKFDYFSQTTLGLYFKFGGKKKDHYDWINPIATIYDDIADVKKKVKLLTGDADKDGVADYLDKEPETPEGVAVTGGGISLDIDNDGIADFKDDEPFSDKGQPVDEKGRMKDDDGDGVPNGRDLEPNTPKGTLVNFQGKTIPMVTNNNNSAGGGGAGYMPTIFFDTDKWYVKPEFYSELLAVSEVLRLNPSLKLDVVGNADYRLDDAHNDMLGNNRAEAVIEVLVKKFGVDRSRLTVKNNGEHLPMVPGKGPAFDPYNRRVNFFVAGTNEMWIIKK